MTSKVAVVNITSFGREFPEFIEILEDKVGQVDKMILDSDTSELNLAKILDGYKYVLLGNHPRFGKEFFKNNNTVKLIARHGIGFNNIDIEEAKKSGVLVTNMPNEIEIDAVAEQAVALVLSVTKNIRLSSEMVKQGEWNIKRERIMGKQIFGSTTGIIGFGNIGQRFSEIMNKGFGNKILVYDPYVSKQVVEQTGAEYVDLDYLLRNSDIISLHANLTEETYQLINEETKNSIKNDAVIINTGRGDLVDEKTILSLIEDKKIFGYGADVTSEEPTPLINPLLRFNNVVITPHSSIYNRTCMKNMNEKVVQDILLMENDKLPQNIVGER